MHLYRAQTGYSTGNVRYEAITDFKVKMFKFEEVQSGDKHFIAMVPLCSGADFYLTTAFVNHEKTRISHQCFKFRQRYHPYAKV